MIVLKTKYLFLNLLKFLQPNLILDIGSMDGSDSLRFRRMCPKSKIIAFEANPYNYQRMSEDINLKKAQITISSQLISNERNRKFYISTDSVSNFGNKGTSSTLKPVGSSDIYEEITLESSSIDEVIRENNSPNQSAALWIDVEGAAYDVLNSALTSKNQILLLHIEVELVEKWVGQKLKNNVIELAKALNLSLIACSSNESQQDLVFVNSSLLNERAAFIKFILFITKFLGPSSSKILEKL
jgi:FkbM family methyltransferase